MAAEARAQVQRGTALRCRALGHDFRFTAEGATMRWSCARGCGAGGTKRYRSADDAHRYAAVFDLKGSRDVGAHAPPLGMFPLRIAGWIRRRARKDTAATTDSGHDRQRPLTHSGH